MIAEHDETKFLAEVKEELNYLGMKYSEVAAKCGIPQNRFMVLMQKKTSFKPEEIVKISQFLGLD